MNLIMVTLLSPIILLGYIWYWIDRAFHAGFRVGEFYHD